VIVIVIEVSRAMLGNVIRVAENRLLMSLLYDFEVIRLVVSQYIEKVVPRRS